MKLNIVLQEAAPRKSAHAKEIERKRKEHEQESDKQQAKRDADEIYHVGAAKATKSSVEEATDPHDAESKWEVVYDTYGTNRDVPLQTGVTKIVYADSKKEAVATATKLFGGRNHTATLIRGPISKAV